MKHPHRRHALLSFCLMCALVLLALASGNPLAAQNPKAKNLPVDKYGMRTWQLVLLRRGPAYGTVQGEARKKLFAGHFENMGRLAKAGKLRLAGPLAAPKDAEANLKARGYAGLFLVDCKTAAEARKICQSDPTIKSKVFNIEVLTWYGPSDITFRGDEQPPGKPASEAPGKKASKQAPAKR